MPRTYDKSNGIHKTEGGPVGTARAARGDDPGDQFELGGYVAGYHYCIVIQLLETWIISIT
jgi:hypothetical protein